MPIQEFIIKVMLQMGTKVISRNIIYKKEYKEKRKTEDKDDKEEETYLRNVFS